MAITCQISSPLCLFPTYMHVQHKTQPGEDNTGLRGSQQTRQSSPKLPSGALGRNRSLYPSLHIGFTMKQQAGLTYRAHPSNHPCYGISCFSALIRASIPQNQFLRTQESSENTPSGSGLFFAEASD
ncbi:unnamed protein product [Diplocarpon coronariae]